MSLLRPPPDVAVLGLRAMRMVGAADGALRPGARRLMRAAQLTFLGVDVDVDGLAAIDPEELARSFPGPLRAQFVHAMIVASLVDGPPTEATSSTVSRFARALGVDEPAVRTVEHFAKGHLLLGTLDYHRRSSIRGMLEGEIEARGWMGAVSSFLGIRGLREDPLIAEPFRALEDLPEGTLGRTLFEHYRSNGFSFPGERGGFPEAGVYHDITHILAGYGTDPYGELQVGAFTAGYRKKDPIFVAMLPLLVFCAEINVTPIPHDHVDAIFAQPGVAERYIVAYERGAQLKCDLSDHWDFWPEMRRPVGDVRKDLGVVALALPS